MTMFDAREHLPPGGAVARQFVGDEHARDIGTAFEQLAEELEGCAFVPSALHQDIQDVPVLFDGAPQIMLLAIDLQKRLVTVPLVARLRAASAQLMSELVAKSEALLPHRFVGHEHASRSQVLFDITKAEVEAMIEPNRVCDNFQRKPKTFVGRCGGVGFHAASIA